MTELGGPTLIGYDGSDDAKDAVRCAGWLLGGRPAVVIHVWQSLAELLLHTDVRRLSGPLREAADELDAEDRRAAERLAAEGASLAQEAGLDARSSIVEGPASAWSALLEIADADDAAVVVVGSRGVSGMESVLLGSVSAGVVHHSRRPVLVAPAGRDGKAMTEPRGPVLIGYDGSERAERAIQIAGALFGGRPALVGTVWRSAHDAAAAAVLGAPASVVSEAADRLDLEIEARATATAEEGAALARGAGLAAEPLTEPCGGKVWAVLCRVAYERSAAALVVGSTGRSRIGAALLGSVSRGVLEHSPAPVLVVPPASR